MSDHAPDHVLLSEGPTAEAPPAAEFLARLAVARQAFALPPRLTENCGAATEGASGTPAGARAKGKAVRFRVVRRGGRYVVTGRTLSGRRLGITVRRARGKVLVSRRAVVRRGRFRTTFGVRRRARWRVSAVTLAATALLAAGCGGLSGSGAPAASPGSLSQGGINLSGQTYTVGGKNFDEQLLLCKMQIAAIQSVPAQLAPMARWLSTSCWT